MNSDIYIVFPEYQIGLGNYDEALRYINKARELNENNELLDELIEDINNLSD